MKSILFFLSLFRPFLCLFFSNGSIADSLNKVGPEKEEFADSYKARPWAYSYICSVLYMYSVEKLKI